MRDHRISQYFAGSCFLIAAVLLYCIMFSTSGKTAYKTDAVIDKHLPKVQLFIANNQFALNDILLWWNSYTSQEDITMDLSAGSLDYILLSKTRNDVLNEEIPSNGIPTDLFEKLLKIEGDDTENIVISFVSDGIVMNYGRFSHTDVVIFSSDQWLDRYIPDEKSVFDLGDGWTAAFIGAARG